MSVRGFQGKVVIVTGAAGGLGRSLCRRFAVAGARVVALDRDAAALAALSRDLTMQGLHASTQTCDVTDAATCASVMQDIRDQLGGIDVLINNAGISHRSAFGDTRIDVIRRVMDVNFFGAVHCTHAALPELRRSHGIVITLSSVAGFSPLIGRTGYAASKHALHGFFDSLRAEVADDGVNVLLVCPSFIATGIDRSALGGDGQPAAHPRQTTGGQAAPDNVAHAIFHAASRNQNLLLFSPTAKLAWWISRVWPALYARLMKRRLQAELKP